MATEKTQAIVLRLVEFSESSFVATLFTEDFGKVGALAKGARRPKSPFEGALDLLALVRIVFLRKSSDALDILTEAKLSRRFRLRGRELAGLYAGYYVAELLAELTDDYDPHPELFDLADQTLAALQDDKQVGRLVFNGFPTGIEPCPAIHHGGPYPACSDAGRTTSIGTAAIERFTRPLCFQGWPDEALPAELQNANPRGIWRMVDGQLTKDAVR